MTIKLTKKLIVKYSLPCGTNANVNDYQNFWITMVIFGELNN